MGNYTKSCLLDFHKQSPKVSVQVEAFCAISFSTVELDSPVQFQNTSLGLDDEFYCSIKSGPQKEIDGTTKEEELFQEGIVYKGNIY